MLPLTLLRLKLATGLFGVFALVLLIQMGCKDSEEETTLASIPSLPALSSPTPTDPFITENGIRVPIIVDRPAGAEPGADLIICEADAQVDVLNGVAVSLAKPQAFNVTLGEPVYRPDGSLLNEPIF